MFSSSSDRRQVLALLAGISTAQLAGSALAQGQPPPTPPSRLMPPEWPNAPSISLWPAGAPGAGDFKPHPTSARTPPVFLQNTRDPTLHIFEPAKSNGKGILVIPGGAYAFVSIDNEGVDIAKYLCPLGYTVFVLNYRLPAEGWRNRADVPLQDAQRAMRLIRSMAPKYGITASSVSVIGFSAGGHLAASLATGFAENLAPQVDAVDSLDARPAAVALIYPVITMADQYTHALSKVSLLGATPSPSEVERRSAERNVTAATPPLFIAHAADDSAVPVENSLMMLAAARSARVPVEAHIFQEGQHAFSVGRPGTPSSQWLPVLHLWLQRIYARTV